MEEKKKENSSSTNQSRRKFLKTSAIASIGAISTGIAITDVNNSVDDSDQKSFSLLTKEHDRIDDIYQIKENYQRMDQKNTVFSRWMWDKKLEVMGTSAGTKLSGMLPNPLNDDNEPGWRTVDHALGVAAAGGVITGTGLSLNGQRNGGVLNNWENHTKKQVKKHKHRFETLSEASMYVKRAATFLGASDAGIAPFDERWVYKKWYDGSGLMTKSAPEIHEDAVFQFEPKSVIVTIYEMDYDALKCEGNVAEAGVMKGYSEMAEVTHKIAIFLNQLGYKAVPAGNDTGLSIPTAIQAGLGENSRMGTLIHEKYGSRVRIAKVYTDMELKPDKPITFGVHEFCKKCKKCSELCPSKSLSFETEPEWEPKTNSISSHPGVKKWYQNNETCAGYWEKLGMGCSICLSVCPYNKLDTWVHDVSKIAVGIPVGRDIARQLDDAFGYGNIKPKNVEEFWKKKS